MPYLQLGVFGAIMLLVLGVIYAAYRWGRASERERVQQAIRDTEREARDAVDAGRRAPLTVDTDWLRRSSTTSSSGIDVPREPPANPGS